MTELARERGSAGPTYNVVVLGAGTAGLVTAAATASLGGRVALVERGRMGGDCLNTGCVPSKALIASARVVDQIRCADRWGIEPREPTVAFERVMESMRERRARIAPHDSRERLESLGVEVFPGEARFVSPHEVRVGDRTLRAKNFVIATGSRASVPSIDGLASVPHYTNETIFDDPRLKPRHLVVLGGGPIGCELGQTFARLGVRVTIIQRAAQILEKEDRDAAHLVQQRLEAEGLRIRTAAQIRRVEADGPAIRLTVAVDGTEESLACDTLLVAAGRRPNTGSLNLEAAGVAFTARGVTVNGFLQTSQPHIYAAGDVVGSYQFTHVADYHARTVVRNILFPWIKVGVEKKVVPWCTFTSPEVARVGLNEREARTRGIECDVFLRSFEDVDRAIVEREEIGCGKVLTQKGGDRILGVTLVGERAGDLLQPFVLAMENGIGLSAIGSAIHPYPTFGEIARQLADERQKSRLTPFARKVLAWLYGRHRGER